MKPIRIGKISFTNILPIYHYFEGRNQTVQFIPEVPTGLNRKMINGEIDMGPISSFSYAEHFHRYLLMPDLSVSATGKVRSIFLFTKGKNLSELNGATVALPQTSASSVALLKILLEKFEGVKPNYITMQPNLGEMMKVADAALIIGDDAILAQWRYPQISFYDLGEEWYNRTGYSMTFAVWAIREDCALAYSDRISHIYQSFMEAKQKGEIHLEEIIQIAQARLGGDSQFWMQYYAGLNYHFGSMEVAGLREYYRCAADIGLLSNEVQIRMYDLPAEVSSRSLGWA
ncbi:menaquinone biosynthesis protein [Hazenella sp. IB182353]|uniref:menaquinone biosynthetic enzyme MqnA/MqnD family protein n=1 Tax=Polycladospora coralii TaxID=2771432 RepID=UPI00174684B9|nr:menaquinone biosynthesis protein [Polycladospora coralii]MBS7529089.1 menaquinone biosynthesis protein [Polycladospora coralii]